MNITKIAEEYIQQHPSVKDALQKGLINYSSLTRLIALEHNLDLKKHFDALLIACRRYAHKIKTEKSLEKEILSLLKESKIEVKNKIMVAVVSSGIYYDDLLTLQKKAKKSGEVFNVIQGSNALTIITAEDFTAEVKKQFKGKILKLHTGLVEIIVKSGKQIEETPGVLSYLSSLLSENGINVVEQMSCWTDTLFVLEEKDAGRVMGLLRF